MQIQPRPLPALFLVLISLSACRDRATPAPVAPAAPIASAASATATTPAPAGDAAPALQRVRGMALMGKDGYGITLCGESTQRIIGVSGQAQAMLDQFLEGGAREFFIDGWAATTAGTGIGLQRIERAYTEGPGCGEAADAKLLVARGNEPFWSLAIDPVGLTLERPDHPALVVPGVSLHSAGDGRQLDAQTAEGALQLVVMPAACSDGMSDTLYASTAKLTLGELALAGCAFAGGGAGPD